MQALLGFAGVDGASDRLESDAKLSFQTIGIMQEKLEQMYGPRGGRGLALRAGRVCFKYGLREFGSEMGLTENAFRLLPMSVKLHTAAQAFADLFNKQTDQIVHIEEAGGKMLWRIERCPLCWERRSQEAVCHLAVGLLQESLYWLSGGRIFNVQETQCVARGEPACLIEIDSTPLD